MAMCAQGHNKNDGAIAATDSGRQANTTHNCIFDLKPCNKSKAPKKERKNERDPIFSCLKPDAIIHPFIHPLDSQFHSRKSRKLR
nr:hypothetical protein [Tanacetum cinerariifolium]